MWCLNLYNVMHLYLPFLRHLVLFPILFANCIFWCNYDVCKMIHCQKTWYMEMTVIKINPRVQEMSTSNMANDKNEPFRLFGLSKRIHRYHGPTQILQRLPRNPENEDTNWIPSAGRRKFRRWFRQLLQMILFLSLVSDFEFSTITLGLKI